MPEYFNISAPDEDSAPDEAAEQYPEYEAFEVIGETIVATNGNPGFYRVAAFETQEKYEKWAADQDWL